MKPGLVCGGGNSHSHSSLWGVRWSTGAVSRSAGPCSLTLPLGYQISNKKSNQINIGPYEHGPAERLTAPVFGPSSGSSSALHRLPLLQPVTRHFDSHRTQHAALVCACHFSPRAETTSPCTIRSRNSVFRAETVSRKMRVLFTCRHERFTRAWLRHWALPPHHLHSV